MEHTVALIKPDAVRRHLVGNIISWAEGLLDLNITLIERRHLTYGQASNFYREHEGKSFFQDLCAFTAGGPMFAMVLSGENAIQAWREAMGPSAVDRRPLTSIRGRWAMHTPEMENLVHGSDSPESFLREARALGWHPGMWQR